MLALATPLAAVWGHSGKEWLALSLGVEGEYYKRKCSAPKTNQLRNSELECGLHEDYCRV